MLHASSFILIVKNAFSIFKFLIAVFLFAKQIIKNTFTKNLAYRHFSTPATRFEAPHCLRTLDSLRPLLL
ncbi:hypothetical protein HpM006_12450 [Helicobacter pylori]